VLPTDLTVAAVVPKDGRYLMVEERASGVVVVAQPGGHIWAGESPEQAVIRETLEETRCTVGRREPKSLLAGMLPVHQNVDRVLASASLV